MTDADGSCATVRRVYRVDGLEVAVLTCDEPGCPVAITWQAVDLLSTTEQPAAFPDHAERTQELTALELAVVRGTANQSQVARYRELRSMLDPYSTAEVHLHWALIADVVEGDQVSYPPHRVLGTVTDPDAMPNGVVRAYMRVRIDAEHLKADAALRRAHPDGTVLLSATTLHPTLGLL
ncbi:hypothetical protein [Kitasatospora sp. MBT66]|uniref:hypothetical protein n=1 Tax=Kitasatospora sp. MBT66 TaxID=1444769 RepID=UPI0005BC70AB|nr:hypothetical protein [Kitasatospora sp. MBT66]